MPQAHNVQETPSLPLPPPAACQLWACHAYVSASLLLLLLLLLLVAVVVGQAGHSSAAVAIVVEHN